MGEVTPTFGWIGQKRDMDNAALLMDIYNLLTVLLTEIRALSTDVKNLQKRETDNGER